MVGEGVTGAPAIGPVDVPERRRRPEGRRERRRRARLHPQPGRAVLLRPGRAGTGHRAADRLRGRHRRSTTRPRSRPSATRSSATSAPTRRRSSRPPPGSCARSTSPSTSTRAARTSWPAYETHTGQFRPGCPAPVNDLQFLTGPSVARRRRPCPARRSSAAPRRSTCAAFNAAGRAAVAGVAEADLRLDGREPGDRLVRDDRHRQRRAQQGDRRDHALRHGARLLAPTRRRARSGSWPRFHHDNANSGDYRRDATLPGQAVRPRARRGTTITFTAPGDDLLCGTADHYEVVQSNGTITGANFVQRGAGRRAPRARRRAGTTQSMHAARRQRRRFVAIRAVDDQGNVGRPAIDRGTELRAAEGRDAAARVARAGLPAVHVARTARTARRSRFALVQPAAAGLRAADRRHARRERPGRELGRVRAARRACSATRRRPPTRPTCRSTVSITDVRRHERPLRLHGRAPASTPLVRITDRLQRPVPERARDRAGHARSP